MYAQLCKRLSEEVSNFGASSSPAPATAANNQQQQPSENEFLSILLKVCRNKFENRFKYYSTQAEQDPNVELSPEEEERQHVVKQKMLGNVKFIGELFLLDQLSDAIIHRCILQLLDNDKVSTDIQVRCQDLECLCQLIRTCGKSLDAGPSVHLMDQYFLKMAKRSQQQRIYPPRIRFMLRDVIELRENEWVPRNVAGTQGPVPIHLLRNNDEEDHHHATAMLSGHGGGGGGGGGRGGDGGGGRGGDGGRDHHHYGSGGGPGSGGGGGGRGGGGHRGDSRQYSDTDQWMSKIPGFNDMFNNLSMGTTSSSSMLPPPPPMHNNHYLGRHSDGGGRDGGRGDYNSHYQRADNKSNHYRNNNYNNNSGGNGYGYNNNNNNSNNNGNNYYGGRGSGGYGSGGGGQDGDRSMEGSSGYNSGGNNNNNNNNANNSHHGSNTGAYNHHNGGRNNNNNNNNNDYQSGGGRDSGNYNNNNNGGNNMNGGNYNNNNYRNRNNQNNYNNYNNNNGGGGNNNNNINNRFNKHGGSSNNNSGQMNGGNNINNNNKDLAPRFKRTMMGGGPGAGGGGGQMGGPGPNAGPLGPNQGIGSAGNNGGNNGGSAAGPGSSDSSSSVDNLQMRPAANSLLFKANTMNVNKQHLPLSQPQVASNMPTPTTRMIPTNSMTSAAAGYGQGTGGGGGNSQNSGSGSYYQGRDSNSGSYKSASGGGKDEKVTLMTLSDKGRRNDTPTKEALVSSKDAAAAKATQDKQAQQQQQQQKQQSKKKDKGPSKEEVLKKFTTFLDEVYFQQYVAADEVALTEKAKEEKSEEKEEIVAAEEKEKMVESSGDSDVVAKKEGAEGETEKVDEKKAEAEPIEQSESEQPECDNQPRREQTLSEIVKKFIDLKVPDKYVKDCLISLYAETLERHGDVTEKEGNDGNDEKATEAGSFWQASPAQRCIQFVGQLKRDTKLNQSSVTESFKQLLQMAADKNVLLTTAAGMITSAIVARSYTLAELGAVTDHGKFYPCLFEVLERLQRRLERKELTELFSASKIDLLQCLPEPDRNKDRLTAVLDERNLNVLCPLLKVQAEMWKQINIEANPQQFYKWIKENVDGPCQKEPGFVTALVTVLIKYITQETTNSTSDGGVPDKELIEREKNALEKYGPVLNVFLADTKLQLIALYAIQVYCHSVDFPKGMLLRWFTALYDLNVIEEDTYFQWKEDLSDAYPGKQRALFQVNAWFTWLQEAEYDDDEEN